MVKIKIELEVEDFKKILEINAPEMYEMYNFLVDKMTNDFYYDKNMIEKYLMSEIFLAINKKSKSTDKEKEI